MIGARGGEQSALRFRSGLVARLLLGVSLAACETVIDPPPMGPYQLPAAEDVTLEDLSDQGHAGDFVVSFATPFDQTDVAEYRVFLVPSATAYRFDLEAAREVTAGRYATSSPGATEHVVPLMEGALTADGEAVGLGVTYTAFVMTVALESAQLAIDALSVGSDPLELSGGAPGTIGTLRSSARSSPVTGG